MGSLLLINIASPLLFLEENIPGKSHIFETFSFVHAHVTNHVGKRFVEPEVIPPLHGDQVSKPHVGDLMEDCVKSILLSIPGWGFSSWDILIVVGNTANVLHGTH